MAPHCACCFNAFIDLGGEGCAVPGVPPLVRRTAPKAANGSMSPMELGLGECDDTKKEHSKQHRCATAAPHRRLLRTLPLPAPATARPDNLLHASKAEEAELSWCAPGPAWE